VVFNILLKFCYEAREIRRWRNETFKKIKAENPGSDPMPVAGLQELIGVDIGD
jgi:hypothetical protein